MTKKKHGEHRALRVLSKLAIWGLTYVLLLGIMFLVFAPERYDLAAGQVSPVTITASKDVVDTVNTNILINEAMSAVSVSYTLDETVLPSILEAVESDFEAITTICTAHLSDGSGDDSYALAFAGELLPDVELSDEDISLLSKASPEMLYDFKLTVLSDYTEVLESRVAQDGEDEACARLENMLLTAETGLDEDTIRLLSRIVSVHMQPNMLIDEETTEFNKQKAADAVEPVIFLKGRNIVRSGEIITAAQIAMLDSLGMLASNTKIDLTMYLGLALLVMLIMSFVFIYSIVFERQLFRNRRQNILLGVILLLGIGISAILMQINQFFMPVVIGVMLTAVLLTPRLALVIDVFLALVGGLMSFGIVGSFSSTVTIIIMCAILSGAVATAILSRHAQRTAILGAGLAAGAVSAATALAVGLITESNTSNILNWAMWEGLSGIVSGVLCIGLQPALEWLFNLVTPAKLMELSNPNHPIIKRMILEASGTYHHSIIVANLAEAAANRIGANGLLARVGAYFHDIGKLNRPLYFKENQIGENPHDKTDPMVSAAILTAHPTDGATLAAKNHLPQPVIDIILQHHGDTPVVYFYDRCVKEMGAENVDINDFRYPGPRPATKEAAIVMLADTVEAAARACQDRSNAGLEALIRKLIRSKIDDTQLNSAPLTLSDIEEVTQAFLTVLSGVFHQRVEYPTLQIPKRDKNAESPAADNKHTETKKADK